MRKEGERFLGSRVLVMTGDITSQTTTFRVLDQDQ